MPDPVRVAIAVPLEAELVERVRAADPRVEVAYAPELAGAALDVFASEPLAAESPLWELPNVLVTPHTAGLSVHENERIVRLFIENLARYLDEEPLRNRVDPELLY